MTTTLSSLDKFEQIAVQAFQMNQVDVYKIIIDFMKKEVKDKDLKITYDLIKTELSKHSYWDEGHTPEDLSQQYLGTNIFVFDVFQYYFMAYLQIQRELEKLFETDILELATADNLVPLLIHKNKIIHQFDETEKYQTSKGNNKHYKTILFQDFLKDREFEIEKVHKEISIIKQILSGEKK